MARELSAIRMTSQMDCWPHVSAPRPAPGPAKGTARSAQGRVRVTGGGTSGAAADGSSGGVPTDPGMTVCAPVTGPPPRNPDPRV